MSTTTLYSSAPPDSWPTVEEGKIRKKTNVMVNSNNSNNNLKEMIIYFKDGNNQSKNKNRIRKCHPIQKGHLIHLVMLLQN